MCLILYTIYNIQYLQYVHSSWMSVTVSQCYANQVHQWLCDSSCLLVMSIQVAGCRHRRRRRRRRGSDVLSTLRLTRLPSNSTYNINN